MENINEKIIELVHINPCIYDKKDFRYKDVKYKEKVWESIGQEINLPAKECKVEWKSLRDRYRKQKSSDDLPSGSSQKIGNQWKYFASLDFLAESMEPASTSSNFSQFDDSVEWLIDESEVTPVSQPKKRKGDELFTEVLMAMKKKYQEPQSNVKHDNFFGLLSEKFARMSESEVDEVQVEILHLINRKLNSKQN